MARFTLTLHPRYVLQGRQLKNIGGRVVVFNDGVAYDVDERTADFAKRYGFIANITKNIEVDTSTVVADAFDESEPTVVLESDNEKEVPDAEVSSEDPDVPEGDEAVEEPEEEPEEEPSVEDSEGDPDVFQLYEQLGTWTAVAEHLGVSLGVLRKMRDEQS